MSRIFQEFNLVEEKEKKKAPEQIQKGRGENLVKELRSKGYTVLVCGSICDGVPVRIIVGGTVGEAGLPNIRKDFGEIVSELEISYQSGHWYMEVM